MKSDWPSSIGSHHSHRLITLASRMPITRKQNLELANVLHSPEYQYWLTTNNETLFCPGMLGTGKTILTAVVIDSLTAEFSNDPKIGIAYIYFDFSLQDKLKVDNLLASLLKQLIQGMSSLPMDVKELYHRHKSRRTQPSLDEISRTLQSIASIYSRVFIIIDALNECQLSHGRDFMFELFRLQKISRMNIFVTSRYISDSVRND
jgi:hypothetical protein